MKSPIQLFHYSAFVMLIGIMSLQLCACSSNYEKKDIVQSESKVLKGEDVKLKDSTINLRDQLVEKQLPEIKAEDGVYPSIFESAFGSNQQGLSQQVLGKLQVKSGKILVGDPANLGALIPFQTDFPSGNFPVEIALAKEGKYWAVHFERVRFSNKKVANWQFALLPGQVPVSMNDSNMYCFRTNTALAVVLDTMTRNVFEQSNPKELWTHVFAELPVKNNYTGFIYSLKNGNLATCNTGLGKGCYSVYIGYDAQGEICRLLIDFSLIEWWQKAPES